MLVSRPAETKGLLFLINLYITNVSLSNTVAIVCLSVMSFSVNDSLFHFVHLVSAFFTYVSWFLFVSFGLWNIRGAG